MNFLDTSIITKDWLQFLENEFNCDYMKNLDSFLYNEQLSGKEIYPYKSEIFNALRCTAFKDVKVVIVGQDPYHGENQAHGLSFSVKPQVKIPPSLKNIYKELQNEYNISMPMHGYLESWARQGVLLLNAVLTVEASKAGSHQKKGWEQFSDKIIETINLNSKNVVFILWGSHAQKKGKGIDCKKHLVLKGPHPSPLSAYRGFFGCDHFKLANEYLVKNNIKAINWEISNEF